MAQVILQRYPVGNPPRPARSLKVWADSDEAQALQIAEINIIEGVHEQLVKLPGLTFSEYCDGAEPGAVVRGVPSQDLERLTDADQQFDLVLTSETLEHVPNLNAALAEIYRVLKPGGLHIFTIPLLPGVPKTFARARRRSDGSIEACDTQIHHPGGDWGYPVFTEFGADAPDIFQESGFEVELWFGPPREDDVAQVFVCRKPL